mgnify:FL=1
MDKRFTQAQVALALRKEQLIRRVEQGESLKAVNQDLGLTYHPKHVSRLRRRYIEGGRHWVALVDGREGGQATKITPEIAQWIVGELHRDPNVTASHLCDAVRSAFGVEVSEGRMRQLAIGLGRQGQPGRPGRASPTVVTSGAPLLIEQTPHAGIFSLRAALWRMEVLPVMTRVLQKCKEQYLQQGSEPALQILTSRSETIASKWLTLILLPCLSLERCYNLIGYQGHGLAAVVPNGIHYKYGALELFLNELARMDFGHPVMDALAVAFCQTFYPGRGHLLTYWDYCVKPLWTQSPQPKSKVTRIGRVMACTKMLFVHGPEGHPLYLVERPGDADLNEDLPQAQDAFTAAIGRPTRVCVVDREGNALFLALAGAQCHPPRSYLTMLDTNQYKSLKDFEILTDWQSLDAWRKPHLEVAWAQWQSPVKRQRDPRRFFLVRPTESTPSRLAVGCIYQPPARWHASDAYAIYHGRWTCQEHRFREMHQMALSANYGYRRVTMPNRTAQRQLAAAQKRVQATQHQLATLQRRLDQQAGRRSQWTARFESRWIERCAQCRDLQDQLRDQTGSTSRHLQTRLARLQSECGADVLSHQHRLDTIHNKDIVPLLHQQAHLEARLTKRQQAINSISINSPFYERNLHKDLIMMASKMILLNAHYYVQQHFCASAEWQKAEFATLNAQLYQKPGVIRVWADRVEVVLEPYRYAHLHQAAEESCKLFNVASLQDEHGRRVTMRVAASEQEFVNLGGMPIRKRQR